MQDWLLGTVDVILTPFTHKFFKDINKNENVKKTVALYFQRKELVHSSDKFTKIRFWDAPFIEVEKMVTKKGVITDLGCGEGIFTNFLAVTSSNRKVLGIEIDDARLKKAMQVSKGLKNVTFKKGDATTEQLPSSDCITLFHLLHHLRSFSDQEKVIINCLSSLKPKGKLIVVEVDQKFSFKYFVSLFVDCFLVPWLFEKRFFTPVYYRSEKDWVKLLESLGTTVKVTKLEEGKPFTHIVLECSK